MVPGVKAYIKMAQEQNINIVEAVQQQAEIKEEVKKEMVKIASLIQHGLVAEEVFNLMEAGEFPELIRPESQAKLMNVVEDFGFTAIVNDVMIEQAVQKTDQAVGIKSFVKMAQKEVKNIEKIVSQTIEQQAELKEKESIKEIAEVALMISQGVQEQEILSMVEAGQLPALSKPEAQAPLVKLVEDEGHSAIVCQVLIEESVKEVAQGWALVFCLEYLQNSLKLKKITLFLL